MTFKVCPTYREDGLATAGFQCNLCGTWVSQNDWHNWLTHFEGDELLCECGHPMTDLWGSGSIDRMTTTLAVRENYRDLFTGDEDVKSRVWYHATKRKNWLNNTQSGKDFFPHVGTLDTVDEFIIQRDGQDTSDDQWWLFEVRINEDAEVQSGDAIHDHVYEGEWARMMRKTRAGVVRYLNSYEAPGAVSLVADPRSLTRVKRISLSAYDPHAQSLADFLAI